MFDFLLIYRYLLVMQTQNWFDVLLLQIINYNFFYPMPSSPTVYLFIYLLLYYILCSCMCIYRATQYCLQIEYYTSLTFGFVEHSA